jgi:mannose-6-phosphate isomerase-like protein (cupin superfamily)
VLVKNRDMESKRNSRPALVDPLKLATAVEEAYRNVPLSHVNDHEIRLSVMTEQFRWHRHPNSDETFLGVDGELVIEFPDRQIVVQPGQLVTVPAGLLHRTRPAGTRSVNLTFERMGAETVFEE